MQHWHVFIEWNEKEFRETYAAYLGGRSQTNPADFWYDREIGFFVRDCAPSCVRSSHNQFSCKDYYIVPLCERLSDCGIFGVSSDENLSYARANREEWIEKGEDVVDGYVERMANYSLEIGATVGWECSV